MNEKYPGTGMSVIETELMTHILQNRIATNKVISDLSEIASGISIALMIPANIEFTGKKNNLGIFIPKSARDFMDQLELYEAFVFVLFTKKSFVYKRCKEIRLEFKEHYQFLHSQFDKHGKSCSAHLLKAIHNSFNAFFIKAKKVKRFKASGITLSLMNRFEEGEDLNLVVPNSCK